MVATADRDTIYVGQPERVLPPLGVTADATIFNGTLVAKIPAGTASPAADSAAYVVWGVATHQAVEADGDDITCARGVFKFDNYASDELDAADIGHWCYVYDDKTVRANPGTFGRRAGIFLGLDDDGQAIVHVGNPQPQSDGKTAVGSPITSGAISPDKGFSFISTTGTTALTLADGSFPGQEVSLVEITASTTPHGVLTPATPTGFATIEFNTVGDCCTLRWDGAAWHIKSQSGCTIA